MIPCTCTLGIQPSALALRVAEVPFSATCPRTASNSARRRASSSSAIAGPGQRSPHGQALPGPVRRQACTGSRERQQPRNKQSFLATMLPHAPAIRAQQGPASRSTPSTSHASLPPSTQHPHLRIRNGAEVSCGFLVFPNCTQNRPGPMRSPPECGVGISEPGATCAHGPRPSHGHPGLLPAVVRQQPLKTKRGGSRH